MIRSTRLAGLLVGLALAGCAGRGDIDRTQPDKVDKSIFVNEDGTPRVFYMRHTVTGVPPTTSVAFEGLMGSLEKVTFRIEENRLWAYRAWDYAPGAQNEFTGGKNNKDTPVAGFQILSHFDVQREYNPSTGEQTNVLVENVTDRPWNQRKFMRVDWSQNAAGPEQLTGQFGYVTQVIPSSYWVRSDDITNPDRPIVRRDYIDITNKFQVVPDLYTCYRVFNAVGAFGDDGGWDCGASEIKVRTSILPVQPSGYEPLEYPDRVVLKDDEGRPIKTYNGVYPCNDSFFSWASKEGASPADCSDAGADMFKKFGFFRTVRQDYDRKVGAVEENRKYYANRWNIWKQSKDEAGNRLPYAAREVKPIVYYTNPEYPEELVELGKSLTGQWNEAFKSTVAALLLTEQNGGAEVSGEEIRAKMAAIPDVVVLKLNSCRLENVKAHLAAHEELRTKLKEQTQLEADALDKSTLLQACSAMESITESLPDGEPMKFTWERNGDLRYSFFHWVDRPQASGPLGYGPSSADPETGEIISAGLYEYGAALDVYAQRSVEMVQALNKQISIDDVIAGKTITDVLRDSRQKRQERQAMKVSPEMLAAARATLGRKGDKNRLQAIAPGASTAKLDALKGTAFEKEHLINSDVLLATLPRYRPGDTVTPEQMEMASPSNWATPLALEKQKEQQSKFMMNGCAYMAEFADDSILGLALELADLPPHDMWLKIREAIYIGLAQHEMGHTLGLRHNFSGSADPLNYFDRYWDIRSALPESEWHKNKLREYQYSTVMDYGAKFNSDMHGLGKYDFAAIRFGYGQLVDVMPNARVTGERLSSQLFADDYRKIPSIVGDQEVLAETWVRPYAPLVAELRDQYLGLPARGANVYTEERPYKFCSDEFNGSFDCKTWDEGADQTEIILNAIDTYRNHYYFQAFQRGRLGWSVSSYNSWLRGRVFARFPEVFQYFYFYAPYFAGDYLETDMLRASLLALNTLGEVLETPEPGLHCMTDENPDLLVKPDGSTGGVCQANATSMTVDVGDGRPYYIDFNDDYYYRITRAGSLYDKMQALIALVNSEARFFRVDTFADAGTDRYLINFYRTFNEQIIDLFTGVILGDPRRFGGVAMGGKYQPVPVVDPSTYGKVNPTTPAYMSAPRIATPMSKTVRWYAMLLAMQNYNNTWDSVVNIAHYMRVALKGADDDIDWGGATVLEFVHPVTQQTFRAAKVSNERPGITATLVDELNALVGKPGVVGSIPSRFGLAPTNTTLGITTPHPYADWHSAKAEVDAAKADTGPNAQLRYDRATAHFDYVNSLVNSRVDTLSDIRTIRRYFAADR
jgi:hypothetical protein